MKLTIFNGSPRGKVSNTKFLLDRFTEGFLEKDGNSVGLVYLNQVKNQDKFLAEFQEAEAVLLAFPLYCDSMPAIVKTFIESLEPLCGRKNNQSIGFFVQGGFPEGIHSMYVVRYLEKLSKRLGCTHLGTITRGGTEGIQDHPHSMITRKTLGQMYMVGKIFSEKGIFDTSIMKKMAKPMKMSWLSGLIFRVTGLPLINHFLWGKKLKENGAYEKRFIRPYVQS